MGNTIVAPAPAPPAGGASGTHIANLDTFTDRKTKSHALLNTSLIVTSAAQFIAVLDKGVDAEHPYYYYILLVLLGLVIALQIVLGVLLFVKHGKTVQNDDAAGNYGRSLSRLNTGVMVVSFIITVFNGIISVVSVADSAKDGSVGVQATVQANATMATT